LEAGDINKIRSITKCMNTWIEPTVEELNNSSSGGMSISIPETELLEMSKIMGGITGTVFKVRTCHAMCMSDWWALLLLTAVSVALLATHTLGSLE
jgi:hypothetical protein